VYVDYSGLKNAAVDNVALRILINRFVDGQENKFHPRMIRIGSGQSSKVLSINGESAINAILNLRQNPTRLYHEINTYRNKQNIAKQKMLEIFALYFYKLMNPVTATKITLEKSKELKSTFIECKSNYDDACFELEIRECICNQLSPQQYSNNNGNNNRNKFGNLNDIRNFLYVKFIERAEIVFSTLSSTGLKVLADNRFSVCLIDEAAQSTEISTLIPLKLGCDQCILCGDPEQLSAVVHCKNGAGSNMLYHQSLFERLQRGGHDVHFLLYQYRMHPLICSFPSMYFYSNRLKNGLPLENFKKPYHKYKEYSPLVFYDLSISQESLTEKTLSYKNENEANFCISLLINLLVAFPNDISLDNVGIISMYAEQVKLLKRKYDTILIPHLTRVTKQLQHSGNSKSGVNVPASTVIRTVDGFQGQEKDIIIVSTVRGDANSSKKGIGFIHDRQRLNVALTRAKYSLLVVGRKTSLETSEMWSDFIKHVEQNGKYIVADKAKLNFRKEVVKNVITNNNINIGMSGSSSSNVIQHQQYPEILLPLSSPIKTADNSSLNTLASAKPLDVVNIVNQINHSMVQSLSNINGNANTLGMTNSVLMPSNTTVPPPHVIQSAVMPPQNVTGTKRSAGNRIGYEELEEGEIFD
jgi:hypothetical protein